MPNTGHEGNAAQPAANDAILTTEPRLSVTTRKRPIPPVVVASVLCALLLIAGTTYVALKGFSSEGPQQQVVTAATPTPSVSPLPDGVGEGATPAEAAENAMRDLTSTEPGMRFTVASVEQHDRWAWISVVVSDDNGARSADGIAMIARLESGRWLAASPSGDAGRVWLCEMPDYLAPQDLKIRYLGPNACL